jgi:apolipoprotein N-acyltransferase
VKVSEQARKAFPIFGSVVLLSLAFPPADLSLLVLVALAPWFATLRDTDSRGAKRSGYLFGLLYFLFQMYWLVPFVGKWTGNTLLACVPWIAAAAIAGLYYLWAGWLVHRCWVMRAPWAIPLVWAGVEGFRSYVIGVAFPWGIIAVPLWPHPMFVQHAAWGTVYFVSATVALVNVLLASFIWPSKDKELQLSLRTSVNYASFLLAIVLLSALRFTSPQSGTEKVYSVGQTGVDMAFGDPKTQQEDLQVAVDVITAFATSQGAEVVVFPEGVATRSASLPPIGPVHPTGDLAVLFGGNRVEGDRVHQTAYAYDGEWKYADKTRLVIFGEYVPFRSALPFLQSFDLPSGDLTPGDELVTLEVDGVKTGQMLCFEGMFPDLAERHCRNGAQVLAVMSIDDWYAHTNAHAQLASAAIWRSIESGLPVLRSASLGTTLWTNSRGRIMSDPAEFGKTAALRAVVTVPAGSDAFNYRFCFVWACWLVMAWVHFARFFGRNRG